ncbi:hypothetical protein [Cohnella sp. 56]|uniref:hypothetical protein n=1 Tax=Cohnella sp. 56 TaxID=3113722 RepID=UPI0030E9E6AB
MSEFIKFVIFSMIEVFGALTIILALFRYKVVHYLVPAIAVDFVMALQSYTLREELTLSYLSPAINLLLITVFVWLIVRVPLLWSFVVSLLGYIVSVLMQALIIVLSFGYLSPAAAQVMPVRGYILQSITGVVLFVIAQYLYKRGLGLSFRFDPLRHKWERVMVIGFIVVMVVAFSVMLYYREVYFDLLLLLVSLLFFAYYLINKEMQR